jgi:hypothetical protein
MRTFSSAALALACCWLAAAHAQDKERGREPERGEAPAPDLDFLEYLGAWAEGDDEWLAIEEWRKDLSADATDAQRGEDAKGAEDAKESETERDDDHESE